MSSKVISPCYQFQVVIVAMLFYSNLYQFSDTFAHVMIVCVT